ncbi:MAG: envelope stress response membrane protein PspB [Pseudomonadota bacterium]
MHPAHVVMTMVFALPFLVVGGFFLIWALKILKGESSKGGERLNEEETRTIQELHYGLTKMEERIEALETILLARDGKEDGK